MISYLKKELSYSISSACGMEDDSVLSLIEKPKNEQHGDLSFPCFIPAKNNNTSPAEYATLLKEKIKLPETFSEINQLGPFLNFKFNFQNVLSKTLLQDESQSDSFIKRKENVIVEYSSPNIAKPFHVGHLRATLIGNCLDKLYRYLGHNVISINHLGDWGTQFGYVYAGCKLWGEPDTFSVASLVSLYKKATAKKEEEENNKSTEDADSVTKIARDYFLRLEAFEKDALAFWQRCVDVSIVYLKDTYNRLNISFDHYLGESFYSDKLDAVKQELENSNLLKESQGAFGVDLGEELGFARILTPDGRSLYLTRDIAAVDYRSKTFHFDKSIYVVGAPQALHFKQLIEIAKKLGKSYYNKIIHIAFGHVLGMKTRGEGQTIELNDFIDEAQERALAAYRNSKTSTENLNVEEISQKVANAAVIFSTLNRNNIKDVHFNWDEALSFQGDSGPYLLYAYARLSSIFEKAKSQGLEPSRSINFESLNFDSAKSLLVKIMEFEEVLISSSKSNEPITLCNYALDLSKCISRAYLDLKVIGADKIDSESRLSLLIKARETLGNCLGILGIQTLERM